MSNDVIENKTPAVVKTATNWRGLAEDVAEQLDGLVPSKNCTCFRAPPCGDCVDYGYARDLLETIKTAAKHEDEGAKANG